MTTTTRPGPDRQRTIAGLLDEYRSFAELIGSLKVPDWTRETRCTGWQVRDVAGHVAGQAIDTVSGAIGTRTPEDQAAALRSESPTALAARLHASIDAITRLATVFDNAAWSGRACAAARRLPARRRHPRRSGPAVRWRPGLSGQPRLRAGALSRDDAAAAEPAIAQLLVIRADRFSEQTGIAVHDFLLAATGRSDPARLLLPEILNIYR